jgi:hypothetical protein
MSSQNNYSSNVNANSDFLDKAQVVLSAQANTNRIDATSTDDIKRTIDALLDEKKLALSRLELEYKSAVSIYNSSLQNKDKTDMYLLNQDREINKNQEKINQLRSEILTLRRQVELGENEYLRKSYKVFFLKHIFVFALIGMFVGLLYKKGTISGNAALLAVVAMAIVFALTFAYNVFINRYRNNNYFHRMDWPDATN